VTEDYYYVTDYKTDFLGQRSVDELAKHYWPQLRLHAFTLQQADPKDEVVLQLVFTEGDER
jgi:ATP-dependent exoDNAse (exonuclease V) beta subunit